MSTFPYLTAKTDRLYLLKVIWNLNCKILSAWHWYVYRAATLRCNQKLAYKCGIIRVFIAVLVPRSSPYIIFNWYQTRYEGRPSQQGAGGDREGGGAGAWYIWFLYIFALVIFFVVIFLWSYFFGCLRCGLFCCIPLFCCCVHCD